jgi:ribosomal protein L35AE/L33A
MTTALSSLDAQAQVTAAKYMGRAEIINYVKSEDKPSERAKILEISAITVKKSNGETVGGSFCFAHAKQQSAH